MQDTPKAFDPDKRKFLSSIAHGSIFFSTTLLSVGVPIAVSFLSDDPVVKENAKESINFHFNVWFWAAIIGGVVGVLSFITLGLLGVVLFPIVAAGFLLHWGLTVWAISHCLGNPDQPFRYPFIFRLI
ncbi:DUF4870 domain-containing protein [Leptolyngbya sp. FACHB-36]|uniref:DUF4870 domain-containing protein n=1 Tax=Leptolyngbya sp. FACHB-36 TaxID=2692808 RepID=UPI001680ABDA|nr:DUF4870 domain-containing protein [Leptolyngbya sp. FACHB-36]MBD2020167.1 DUF4870 domain-containing protein [Leptolyngbya sp. FACHB-36]